MDYKNQKANSVYKCLSNTIPKKYFCCQSFIKVENNQQHDIQQENVPKEEAEKMKRIKELCQASFGYIKCLEQMLVTVLEQKESQCATDSDLKIDVGQVTNILSPGFQKEVFESAIKGHVTPELDRICAPWKAGPHVTLTDEEKSVIQHFNNLAKENCVQPPPSEKETRVPAPIFTVPLQKLNLLSGGGIVQENPQPIVQPVMDYCLSDNQISPLATRPRSPYGQDFPISPRSYQVIQSAVHNNQSQDLLSPAYSDAVTSASPSTNQVIPSSPLCGSSFCYSNPSNCKEAVLSPPPSNTSSSCNVQEGVQLSPLSRKEDVPFQVLLSQYTGFVNVSHTSLNTSSTIHHFPKDTDPQTCPTRFSSSAKHIESNISLPCTSTESRSTSTSSISDCSYHSDDSSSQVQGLHIVKNSPEEKCTKGKEKGLKDVLDSGYHGVFQTLLLEGCNNPKESFNDLDSCLWSKETPLDDIEVGKIIF